MKTTKTLALLIALAMFAALLLTCCTKPQDTPTPGTTDAPATDVPTDTPTEAPAEDDSKYVVANVKLVGTDTNNSNFMKGFSMQGEAGELMNDDEVFSFAMCYSTADLEAVKAFFAGERFSDPASFLAEIEALDTNGNIRNLAGDRKTYLDGNVDDPIRFYGDGIDLINDVSLLQNAGEYHFYIVTVGNEKVLAVSEADRTFVMEQAAIDLSNAFADAFDAIGSEVTLMEGEDVSELTEEARLQAVREYVDGKLAELGSGVTATVEYEADPDYPDDYTVILSKDGAESSAYLTVYFG